MVGPFCGTDIAPFATCLFKGFDPLVSDVNAHFQWFVQAGVVCTVLMQLFALNLTFCLLDAVVQHSAPYSDVLLKAT